VPFNLENFRTGVGGSIFEKGLDKVLDNTNFPKLRTYTLYPIYYEKERKKERTNQHQARTCHTKNLTLFLRPY